MAKLKVTPAEVKKWTEEELWSIPHHKLVEVTFDDGVKKEGTMIHLAISSYYWRVSFKYGLPVNSNLWADEDVFTDKLHSKLMWAAIEPTSWDEVKYNKEQVWLDLMTDTYNALYVAVGKYLSIYMSGVGMEEINIYLQDEEINEAISSIRTYHDVGPAHKKIGDVILTKHKETSFHQDIINGATKLAQAIQSFSRGTTTDNDSSVFLMASSRGFGMGIRDMSSLAKESCSAVKAIQAQKDPVRDASTQDRRMQLVCGVIQTLVPGDCGSKDYVKINIPREKGAAKDICESCIGMYMHVGNHKLKLIDADNVDDIKPGSQIELRTTLSCNHLHRQGVCSTCYGRMSYSLSYGSNPGFVSAVSINSRIVQLIISTKHLDYVTSVFRAALKGKEKNYLRVNPEQPTDIHIKEEVFEQVEKQKGELWISIPSKCAPRLSIVNTLRSVDIPISSISSLDSEISLFMKKGGADHLLESFNLRCRSNMPSLSRDMLKFLKGDKWVMSPDGKAIHICLSKWKQSKPIISFPLKHENMMEFSNSVKKFLMSADDKAKEVSTNTLCSYTSVSEALNDTYSLLSANLKGLYMGHIATALAASRIVSSEDNDYGLPKNMYEGEFSAYPALFKSRSLSATVLDGFIDQRSVGNLASYTISDRPELFTDDFIMMEPDRYDYGFEQAQ